MEREVVYLSQILAWRKKTSLKSFVGLLVADLVFFAAVFVFIGICLQEWKAVWWSYGGFTAFILCLAVWELIGWHRLQKTGVRVFRDVLVESKQGTGRGENTRLFSRPYSLVFATYGKYDIPMQNYLWSEYFATDAEGVYNRACIARPW